MQVAHVITRLPRDISLAQNLRACALQVVLAPHIYCAGVSGSALASSGTDLYSKLDTTFGYLTQGGKLHPATLASCPGALHY